MRTISEIGANIDLKNIVIHRLNKDLGREASMRCAQEVLPITAIEKQFIGKVTDAYQKKSSPTYGIFDDEAPDFKNRLYKFTTNEWQFLEFTKQVMTLYKNIIKRVVSATGAFMVFAHYLNTKTQCFYLLVLAINNKPGYIVKDTLTLKNTKNIDLSKIDLACIINLTKWSNYINGIQSDSKTYLSFVKGKKNISDYFMKDFIGCDNKQTNEEASNKLVHAITSYCKYKGFSDEETKATKERVFKYCQDRMSQNSEIPLDGVSFLIDGDNPRDFTEFASQEEYGVSAMISGNKTVLKNLNRIRFHNSNIHIEFQQSLLDDTVFYNAEHQELTFRNLPAELIAQLE
jgi:nucleoid-associated protein